MIILIMVSALIAGMWGTLHTFRMSYIEEQRELQMLQKQFVEYLAAKARYQKTKSNEAKQAYDSIALKLHDKFHNDYLNLDDQLDLFVEIGMEASNRSLEAAIVRQLRANTIYKLG